MEPEWSNASSVTATPKRPLHTTTTRRLRLRPHWKISTPALHRMQVIYLACQIADSVGMSEASRRICSTQALENTGLDFLRKHRIQAISDLELTGSACRPGQPETDYSATLIWCYSAAINLCHFDTIGQWPKTSKMPTSRSNRRSLISQGPMRLSTQSSDAMA